MADAVQEVKEPVDVRKKRKRRQKKKPTEEKQEEQDTVTIP